MSDITTWYLESNSPSELIPADDPGNLDILEARVKQYAFNRFLYEWVGKPWQWFDKLSWSDRQWQDYAEADNLRTWVAWCEGSPAGYFELQRQPGGEVEICYLGLTPGFIGKGMGGYLLSECIRRAWDWDAGKVRVNTCTLDHPSALANYQARGLSVYRVETHPESE